MRVGDVCSPSVETSARAHSHVREIRGEKSRTLKNYFHIRMLFYATRRAMERDVQMEMSHKKGG